MIVVEDGYQLIVYHKIIGCQYSQTEITSLSDWVDGYSPGSNC